MNKVVLLGPPGSGKGTQGAKLAEKLNVPLVVLGDILRAAVREKTVAGIKAESFMSRGALVPDAIVVAIAKEHLEKLSGFVLDGYPRTIEQAKALEQAAKIDRVFYFAVPEDMIIGRLSGRRSCSKCGAVYHLISKPTKVAGLCDACGDKLIIRNDDQEVVIRNRFAAYHKQTEPLVAYYEGQGILTRIDAAQDIAAVEADLLAKV